MGIFDRFRKAPEKTPSPTPPPSPSPAPQPVVKPEDARRFEAILAPFSEPENGFYNAEHEARKDEALQKIMAEGREGEVFLLQYLLRDTTMKGGMFLLAPLGELAHMAWVQKARMVRALACATDPYIPGKLGDILLCKGTENQFYVIFQPAVAAALGKLRAYDALLAFTQSGQNVPSQLICKDILRLHQAGTIDKPENQRDDKGMAPLHIASRDGHMGRVRTLLDAGADVDIICDQGESIGQTPLFIAVISEKPEVVRALIDAHANLNASDLYGSFPLQRAAAMGLAEVARALVDAGADKTQKTLTGKTALDWAVQNNHPDIASLLR